MELQARPKERSFLEKRYIEAANRLSDRSLTAPDVLIYEQVQPAIGRPPRNEEMEALVDEALGGGKPEAVFFEE